MSWTKADGDAHSDLAHTLFLSSKTIADTFPVVARADEVTSWRDAVFEVVASVELSHSVLVLSLSILSVGQVRRQWRD
jgi:hypothetical protein